MLPRSEQLRISFPQRSQFGGMSFATLNAKGCALTTSRCFEFWLERFISDISTKVLNERLRKLLDYGLIVLREFSGKFCAWNTV